MNNNCFVISLNGLASGETTFLGHADKKFFVKFENYEILDADLRVTMVVDKGQNSVDIDCSISGTITVPCDRCLEPVDMPVCADAVLRLRLGGDSAIEDSMEEVFLTEGTDLLDLNQEIYDYSLLALPLQRFHKEGECDPAALDYLSRVEDDEPAPQMDTPFSNLADMLNKRN